jgi:hypothetical protein
VRWSASGAESTARHCWSKGAILARMADKLVWLEASDHGIAVRALLWLERGGRYGDDACPWCLAGRGFHDSTCGLSFALTRQGLASLQERERARKDIESFPHASAQTLAVTSTR